MNMNSIHIRSIAADLSLIANDPRHMSSSIVQVTMEQAAANIRQLSITSPELHRLAGVLTSVAASESDLETCRRSARAIIAALRSEADVEAHRAANDDTPPRAPRKPWLGRMVPMLRAFVRAAPHAS